LHHAGKSGAQRGTSKREDILDVVLSLRKPLDDEHPGASFEVHFEKARHLFGDDTKPFVATLSEGLWETEAVEDNTYRKVVSMTVEGYSQIEISKELDIHKSNVSRHIKKAREVGDLAAKSTGGNGDV